MRKMLHRGTGMHLPISSHICLPITPTCTKGPESDNTAKSGTHVRGLISETHCAYNGLIPPLYAVACCVIPILVCVKRGCAAPSTLRPIARQIIVPPSQVGAVEGEGAPPGAGPLSGVGAPPGVGAGSEAPTLRTTRGSPVGWADPPCGSKVKKISLPGWGMMSTKE